MATVLEPTTADATVVTAPKPVPVLRRPTNTQGFWGWITTVDHKRIGIMYGVTAFTFFMFGGVEALLIRLQLARPNGTFLSADLYNQLFTMHGTTMIFLVVMPISAAFFNYFAPIMVGARDVAFPHAGVRVDDAGRQLPVVVRHADHHGRVVPADVRPPVRSELLQPGGGR